ncbi:MAG: MBL fold metallo-hydrolase [Actinomycetaceae bacterium]|nr:MBL fold metallo-hydrolase [Actinomycetaceae bacterium]
MRVTIVGCSGSMSGPASAASSYLVQAEDGQARAHSFVMDFGPGAMGQLLNYLDPADLHAMALSHLHADHCSDIVGMQVYRRWIPGGPLAPIPVYSPEDGQARTRQVGGDPEEETYEGEFDFRRVGPGDVFTVGPMVVEAFEAYHTVPCVGFRITGPSEFDPQAEVVMGYTGDTDLCDSQVDMARGVDLLLSECAFEDGRDTVRGVHMTGSRAGELAQSAGAKSMLMTHLQPWTDPEKVRRAAEQVYDGPVRCVAPGETYRI